MATRRGNHQSHVHPRLPADAFSPFRRFYPTIHLSRADPFNCSTFFSDERVFLIAFSTMSCTQTTRMRIQSDPQLWNSIFLSSGRTFTFLLVLIPRFTLAVFHRADLEYFRPIIPATDRLCPPFFTPFPFTRFEFLLYFP